MTKQVTIFTFILTVCLASCGQSKTQTKNHEQQTNAYEIDTSVIAILQFNPTEYWIFKDGKPINLTSEDLLKIENILKIY